MSNKQIKCKHCGADINPKAEICPSCGVKNKKPFYKKAWFIIAVIIILIAIVASSGDEEKQTSTNNEQVTQSAESADKTEEITYEEYAVSQLMNDLEANALNAKNTYNKKYVKLTGVLSNIDSDGAYISIRPSDNPYSIINVQCYLKNDEQKTAVANMSIDQSIVVYGKITNVGEVLGYSLDVDKFE